MILYAAADLLWSTRIKGTCEALGIAARPVRAPEMLDSRLADSDVRALLVDLETGEQAVDFIRRTRASSNGSRIFILAFGPHVAVQQFEAARQAGADRVMARGAFADRLPQLVSELAGPDAPPWQRAGEPV